MLRPGLSELLRLERGGVQNGNRHTRMEAIAELYRIGGIGIPDLKAGQRTAGPLCRPNLAPRARRAALQQLVYSFGDRLSYGAKRLLMLTGEAQILDRFSRLACFEGKPPEEMLTVPLGQEIAEAAEAFAKMEAAVCGIPGLEMMLSGIKMLDGTECGILAGEKIYEEGVLHFPRALPEVLTSLVRRVLATSDYNQGQNLLLGGLLSMDPKFAKMLPFFEMVFRQEVTAERKLNALREIGVDRMPQVFGMSIDSPPRGNILFNSEEGGFWVEEALRFASETECQVEAYQTDLRYYALFLFFGEEEKRFLWQPDGESHRQIEEEGHQAVIPFFYLDYINRVHWEGVQETLELVWVMEILDAVAHNKIDSLLLHRKKALLQKTGDDFWGMMATLLVAKKLRFLLDSSETNHAELAAFQTALTADERWRRRLESELNSFVRTIHRVLLKS